MNEADFIPEDMIVCKRCIFYHECPEMYECETLKRIWENVRNGNCPEEVR